MKIRAILVAVALLLAVSVASGLAEFVTNETPVLNMGVVGDPDPTQAPAPTPDPNMGSTMMMAPEGAATGDADQSADANQAAAPTEQFLDANGEQAQYGKTNKKGVNVRLKMNTDSKSVLRIGNTGTPVKILSVETNGNTKWFSVEVKGKTGYIRADLVDVLTAAEYAVAEAEDQERARQAAARNANKSSSSSSGGSSNGYLTVPTAPPNYNGVLPDQEIHLYDGCAKCLSDGVG